jgi:CTP synthase (UTP-ammonia lyase)
VVGVLRIGLIGDFDPTVTAHQAIPVALRFAAQSVGRTMEPTWVHTATLGRDPSHQLSAFAARWCVPASPYENEEGALAAIRFAGSPVAPTWEHAAGSSTPCWNTPATSSGFVTPSTQRLNPTRPCP